MSSVLIKDDDVRRSHCISFVSATEDVSYSKNEDNFPEDSRPSRRFCICIEVGIEGLFEDDFSSVWNSHGEDVATTRRFSDVDNKDIDFLFSRCDRVID